MGIIAGPSIVDDESLIFHYDMGNTVRSFKGKPTTNLNSESAYTVEEIGGYPLLRAERVVDPESPSGYALEQQITDLSINGASRAQMGNATNIPTSGNGYVSVYAKQIAGGGWIVPRVYTGANWYTLQPLDGGTGYLTSEYRRFGRDVTFGTSSGGPLPAFSMTHSTSEMALDKITRWHSPQVETGTFITPYVNGTRSNTQAIVDLTSNETVTANSVTYNSDGTFRFGNGQYITLPNAATTFGTGSVSTSVEFWVRPIDNTDTTRIPVGHQNVTNQRFYIGITSSNWDVGWGDFAWGAGNYTGTRPTADYDVYQHICVTINAGVVSLYKNGVKSTFSKTDTDVSQSGVFPIGTYFDQGNPAVSYYGIDDIPIFRIYNKTLTDAEVKQNYESQKGRFL